LLNFQSSSLKLIFKSDSDYSYQIGVLPYLFLSNKTKPRPAPRNTPTITKDQPAYRSGWRSWKTGKDFSFVPCSIKEMGIKTKAGWGHKFVSKIRNRFFRADGILKDVSPECILKGSRYSRNLIRSI